MTTETPTYGEDGRTRHLDPLTVTELRRGEEFTSVDCAGSGFMTPNEYGDQLTVGTEFELEVVQLSLITGIRVGGRWLYRKSDQDLARGRAERSAAYERQKREDLEENRAEWARRENALPEWMMDRLDVFHEIGGDHFELEGWGYELAVAELAVAYVASGLQEDESIKALDEAMGASGNQHGFAKALAKAHLDGEDLAETVSALSPITGEPYYEPKAAA